MKYPNPWIVAISFFAWFSISAFSCSVIITTDVFFEKNASLISSEEFIKLSTWLKKARLDYPDALPISISANVEGNEADGVQLGRRRELAARLAIVDIDPSSPTTHTFEKVFVWKVGALGMRNGENGKRVEIQYFPKGNFCGR